MHCHLLIPGLFPPFRPETRHALRDLSLPALATLLARGNRETLPDDSMDAWLCRSFGVSHPLLNPLPQAGEEANVRSQGSSPWLYSAEAEQHTRNGSCFDCDWPVAALTLLAEGGSPGGDFWLLAEPVHLQLQRDRLVLADAANLDITREEADNLTTALNEHFANEGMHFFPTRPGRWHLRLTHPPADLQTHSLETAIGRNIRNMLPSGTDGKRWHSLLNEIQMLLHRHPVNAAREERGLPPVNSIWPWGGGALPAKPISPYTHIWADHAPARGLAALTGAPCASVPETATEWLHATQAGSQHLVVLDALHTPALYGDVYRWRETLLHLEKNWFGPLRQALSRNKISRLTLTAFDNGQTRSFSASRTDLWKIWRRGKSLEATMENPET